MTKFTAMYRHIFFISLFWSTAIIAQPGPQDLSPLKHYDLKSFYLLGKVKKLTEKSFSKKIKGWSEGSTEIYSFDENGRLTEKKSVLMFEGMSMGTITETFSYDTKGKLVKDTYTDATGKAPEVQTFLYDAKGKLSGMDFKASMDNNKERYEYDAQGRLSSIKYFRAVAAKTPYRTVKYSYDGVGRLLQSESTNIETNKTSRTKYTYMGNSTYPFTAAFEGDIDLSMTQATGTEYAYNQKGEVISAIPYNASGKINMNAMSYVYEYDVAGNWTKATNNGWGAGYRTRAFEYYSEESPALAYRKSIMDLATPPLDAFPKLLDAASIDNADIIKLAADKKVLINMVNYNLPKLRAVKDLPGNESKQLMMKMLEYIVSPATLKKLDDIIIKKEGYQKGLKEIVDDLTKLRMATMTEVRKLPG